MFNRFIAEYPPEELEMHEILLEDAYETYPYSIISILQDYEENIVEEQFAKAFKRYIDFFEISVQYCSSLILSLIKHRNIEFNDTLQDVATKIVSKPLSTGDWINDIFIVLVKEAHLLIPGEAIVESLYEMITEPKGNIMQGWSSRKGEEYKSIAYFRNTYLGHDTSLADEIYAEGLKLVESRMFSMLEALAPLEDMTTFTLDKVLDDENSPGKYTIISLKSADINRPIRVSSDSILVKDKYYLIHRKIKKFDHFKADELIGITPFIIYLPISDDPEGERTPFIFQSVHNKNLKRMIYISPNLKAKRKETELFKDYFVAFLQNILSKVSIGKNYKLEIASGKTWDEYQERLLSQSIRFLGQMKVEKYDSELYVDRKEISNAWSFFNTLDHKRAFVLLGNAGSGKTNLICNFAEKLMTEKEAVITFNCKIFSQISIDKKLGQIIEEKNIPIEKSLEKLNKMARKNNKKVVFFFDAINECLNYNKDPLSNGPVDLLLAIDNLLVKVEYDCFRFLFTCRNYTWEEAIRSEEDTLNLPCYFTSEDITDQKQRENISLKGFSEEEFMLAYPKYMEKYKLSTSLETILEPQYAFAMSRLQDPMVLKIASQIYSGRNLPNSIQQFDSVKLFDERLNKLKAAKTGYQQIMILEDFARILRNRKTDALPMQELYAAFDNDNHELHELAEQLFKGEILEWRIPPKALFDEGFLRIEKTTLKEELRFTYERFHEYMYARIFVQEEMAQLPSGMPIPVKSYETELIDMKGYAVINDALRHALALDYNRTNGDPSTIIGLANSNVYATTELVMNTLSSLISDNYEDVCSIIKQLLAYKMEESTPYADDMGIKEALLIQGKKGKKNFTKEEIKILNQEIEEIQEKLKPVIQVRKIAMQTIYEIFKSPVYDKNLYQGNNSPFELLLKAMSDPIAKVRDNVSLYIYYISKYDASIGVTILEYLSNNILDTSLLSLVKSSKRKEFQQSFMEPAGRLSLLMVIEGLIERNDYEMSDNIKKTWTAIMKKLTLNHTLIKVVMPFLKIFMKRQATVQAAYVNNGIEYQNFWENIAKDGANNDWHRKSFTNIIPFLNPGKTGLEEYYGVIIKGIDTGDAFSYFLIERVLVAQGWAKWERIKPIIEEVVNKPNDQPWLDYMQMSMLYVLFHTIEKSETASEEAFNLFARLTEEWSERCKGLFFAHKNEQANKGLPYKQYPLNWYGAAYCKHFKDGGTRHGDPYPLPVFRNLIDKAFETKDKELLYYCIENIATMVTDFGKPKSAIQLFDYVISLFKHESDIYAFDSQESPREEYEQDLRTFLRNMIGTIKSYYPREVSYFVHHKLAHSDFPEMDKFREDLMAYNQSHESIGDLLTHKFGNFIIWGLLHDKEVGRFFIDGFTIGGEVKDYFSWFDGIVRISFNRLFGFKL
jgi:hypothetical protein